MPHRNFNAGGLQLRKRALKHAVLLLIQRKILRIREMGIDARQGKPFFAGPVFFDPGRQFPRLNADAVQPGVNLELELCFCAELPGSFRVILQESQSPACQSQIRCDGRFGLKGRAVPHDQDFAVDTRFPKCKAFLNLRNREAADFRILGIDFCGRNRSEPVEIVFQDRNQLNARPQFRKDLFRILPQDSEVNLKIRIIQKLIHHLFFLFLFHTAPDTWKVPNAALWYYIVLFDFMQEEFISIQKFFCFNRFLFFFSTRDLE